MEDVGAERKSREGALNAHEFRRWVNQFTHFSTKGIEKRVIVLEVEYLRNNSKSQGRKR